LQCIYTKAVIEFEDHEDHTRGEDAEEKKYQKSSFLTLNRSTTSSFAGSMFQV
jgi:hypothetical protein